MKKQLIRLTISSAKLWFKWDFHEKYEFGFNPTFKIKVPKNVSSDRLIEFSDDIFKRVGDFLN